MSATLLDELIEPLADCLTIEAAERIASVRASAALQERVDELADKANRGVLTANEQSEYDRYLAAYHLVTLMQARARRILNV
jgi:hypothetical protein